MHELLGIKHATYVAALFGAIVYAMRVGSQTWTARITGAIVGFLFAVFVSPAISDILAASEPLARGIAFLTGLTGAALAEALIGYAKHPVEVWNKFRKK